MKIIEPEYYKDFECIGGKCTNTCCMGWNIWIDKESFNKYKDEEDEFSRKLKRSIKRKKESDDEDDDYGEFVLDINNRCSLLNKNNLCELYINKGEEFLCKTCTVFPRTGNEYIEGILEKNLEVSCPVVAKYLVDKVNGIKIIEQEEEINELDEKIMVEWYDGDEEKDKISFNARNLFLKIAKHKEISLNERILLIKEIQDEITQELNKDEYDKCNKLITSYQNEHEYKLKEKKTIYNEDIVKKYELVFKIINYIFQEQFFVDEKLEDYIEEFTKLMKEINSGKYTKVRDDEFEKFFNEKEYILENYFVYDIYKNYMGSIVDYDGDRIVNLAIVSIGILRSLFISYWNINKSLGNNIIIDIINLYEKYMQEDFIREKINEFIEENNLKSVVNLSILI